MLQFAVLLGVILLLCVIGAIIGFVYEGKVGCFFYFHRGGNVSASVGLLGGFLSVCQQDYSTSMYKFSRFFGRENNTQ